MQRSTGQGRINAGGHESPLWRLQAMTYQSMLRVLVVEDEMLIREMVVEALTDAGFEVLEAVNGEEALSFCDQGAPDVLVTNVCLPGRIDGWEITERCREGDPELPVIYATAFSPVR